MNRYTRLPCMLFFFLPHCFLYTQTVKDPVAERISQALGSQTSEVVVEQLQKVATTEKTLDAKKRVIIILAQYLERSQEFVSAAQQYEKAVSLEPSKPDYSLILDAARCFIAINDLDSADTRIRSVLLSCFEDKILIRARVLAVLVQMGRGDRKEAFALMSSYADNPLFAEWAPMLLFAQWWSSSDPVIREKLISRWPHSPEALCIRGESRLIPASFWYLMNRDESLVQAFNSRTESVSIRSDQDVPESSVETLPAPKAGTASENSVTSLQLETGSIWQQIGFFKTREYAEELHKKLTSLGFVPVIRAVTRPSGTQYYQVLVPEDAEHTAGQKLKNAGFESYLLVD